ncbi:MAG: trypsin-like peptidase domain-containing protein [Nannocystaceae bacterium]
MTVAPAAPKPVARLRWLTLAIKCVALLAGGTITVLALASAVALASERVWLQLAVAGIVAIALPLALADKLLPRTGTSRPGLVSDVTASCWMIATAVVVALAPARLQARFEAQAHALDGAGLRRGAWVMRWLAAVPAPAVEPAAWADGVRAAVPGPTPVPVPTPAAGAEFTPAPPGSDRAPLEPAVLFQRWAPSGVTLQVSRGGDDGVGTGFVVDARGTIATNHHVVADAERIAVKLFDGTRIDRVELLDSDADADLALIRVQTDHALVPVVLGVSDDVVVGETVVVIGNPIGLEHTLTDGLVSARRVYEGKKFIQMSAPVSPGNSGGPVFNRYGDVVGVTVAKLFGENLNLAVPIDRLKPMIKSEYPAARAVGESRW